MIRMDDDNVLRVLRELLAPKGAAEALKMMQEIYRRRMDGREKSRDFDEFHRLEIRWPQFIGFLDVEVPIEA